MQVLQSVPEQERHLLRQFYRLLLSYGDFKHAKLIAEHTLDEELHAKYPGQIAPLLQALNCSMIMAYCRPFSGNAGARGTSIPDLPARFLKLLSPEEKEVHEIVLFDRNKYMAHTDAEAAALEPVRVQFEGQKELLMPLVEDRLAPLAEEPTRLILSASTKLLHAVVEERMKVEPSLLKHFRVARMDELFSGAGDA
jgi:hypothetical protein